MVASLNLHGERDAATILKGLRRAGPLAGADLILLQEVEVVQDQGSQVVSEMARDLGFYYVFGEAEQLSARKVHGLALLSRYPLSEPEILRLKHWRVRGSSLHCRVAVGATLSSPWGKIRAYTLHLDTRINSRQRVQQLRPVVEQGAVFPGPVVIAGDFNTQNFRWVGSLFPIPFAQRQARAVRKAMGREGFRTPFTGTGKTHKWAPLKLDWIFLKGLAWSEKGIQKVNFSDHRALWTRIAPVGFDSEGREGGAALHPAPVHSPGKGRDG